MTRVIERDFEEFRISVD